MILGGWVFLMSKLASRVRPFPYVQVMGLCEARNLYNHPPTDLKSYTQILHFKIHILNPTPDTLITRELMASLSPKPQTLNTWLPSTLGLGFRAQALNTRLSSTLLRMGLTRTYTDIQP